MAADERAPETSTNRVTEQENEMRAIDCPCGRHFEGAGDQELFGLCREHPDREHPEMQRSDDRILDDYDHVPIRSHIFTLAYKRTRECLRNDACDVLEHTSA